MRRGANGEKPPERDERPVRVQVAFGRIRPEEEYSHPRGCINGDGARPDRPGDPVGRACRSPRARARDVILTPRPRTPTPSRAKRAWGLVAASVCAGTASSPSFARTRARYESGDCRRPRIDSRELGTTRGVPHPLGHRERHGAWSRAQAGRRLDTCPRSVRSCRRQKGGSLVDPSFLRRDGRRA